MSHAPTRPVSIAETLWVLGLAVVVRLVHLLAFRDSPFFVAPILDSAYHDALAMRLAAGEWDAGAPYFRPPLFVWSLGALYALFGAGAWAGRLLGAACGVATALLVLHTGARLGLGRGPRVAAAVGVAVAGPLLFLETELLATPLATALGALGLYATVRATREEGSGAWLLAGAAYALAALARAPFALFPFGLALLAFRQPSRSWKHAAAALLPALILWSGPALLMAGHGVGFRFPSTQAGINFHAGNHPEADGRSVVLPPELRLTGWRDFEEDTVRLAAARAGRSVNPAEASTVWFREGLRWWTSAPLAASRLSLAKLGYLLHGYESPNNRSLYEARVDSPALSLFLWRVPGAYWPSGLLIPLALVGLWSTRRRVAWAGVAGHAWLVLLPLIAFFVCARFRAPALPALVLLAVAGAMALRCGSWTLRGVALVLYLGCNLPWAPAIAEDPVRESLARAEASFNAGDLAGAEALYQRVLAGDPGEARGSLGLAAIEERRGNHGNALRHLNSVEAVLGGTVTHAMATARVLDHLGRGTEAARRLSGPALEHPGNLDLQIQYALTLESIGDDADAFRILSSLDFDRLPPEPLNSLGRFRRLAGDSRGAETAWRRATTLEPGFFKAWYNLGLLFAEADRPREAREAMESALRAARDSQDRQRAEEALNLIRKRLP